MRILLWPVCMQVVYHGSGADPMLQLARMALCAAATRLGMAAASRPVTELSTTEPVFIFPPSRVCAAFAVRFLMAAWEARTMLAVRVALVPCMGMDQPACGSLGHAPVWPHTRLNTVCVLHSAWPVPATSAGPQAEETHRPGGAGQSALRGLLM